MTEKRKAILKSMRNVLKDWDESAHPRDENGRFAGGGGSTSGGAESITGNKSERATAATNWMKSMDGQPASSKTESAAKQAMNKVKTGTKMELKGETYEKVSGISDSGNYAEDKWKSSSGQTYSTNYLGNSTGSNGAFSAPSFSYKSSAGSSSGYYDSKRGVYVF